MTQKVLISIIIPIYNVEKYLVECIDSVLNQSLKDIEVICINDKSPDNCGEIIDEYSKKDSRIKAIHHKVNKGLAPARNTGIKNATGEFIIFLDSDDLLSPNALEVMYNKAEKTNSDIVVGDFFTFLEDEKTNIDFRERKANKQFNEEFSVLSEVFNAKDLYKAKDFDFIYTNLYFMVAWVKLFRRRVFEENEILAPDLRCAEDFVMIKKATHLAKKITTVDDVVMYYRKHAESFTSTRKPYVFDIFKSYKPAIKMFKETGYLEQEYTNIHSFFANAYDAHLKLFTPYKMMPKFFWKIHKEIQSWDLNKIDKKALNRKALSVIKFYGKNDFKFLFACLSFTVRTIKNKIKSK